MDFELFPKGIYQLFTAITLTITSLFHPINQTPNFPLVDPHFSQPVTIIQEKVSLQLDSQSSSESSEINNEIIVPESLALEAAQASLISLPIVKPIVKPTVAPSIATPIPAPSTKPIPSPSATPISSPISTPFPTPTSSPTPKPTSKPTPVPTFSPIPININASASAIPKVVLIIPSPKPIIKQKSLDSELILKLINDQRNKLKLPAFEKDQKLCTLALYRGPQLYDEIFNTGKLHFGLYDLNLPYWITENMAYFDSEQLVVQWWMRSFIHRSAILGDFKYSCGVCVGNACAQLFTNYIPKLKL